MEKFARFIKDAPTPEGDHKPRRIKVAVLDDGFDFVDLIDEFEENTIIGKAFTSGTGLVGEGWSGGFPNVEYFSDDGHGTLMAQLIRKICPKVEFYMGKMENELNSDDGGKAFVPTLESAVSVCINRHTRPSFSIGTPRPANTSESIIYRRSNGRSKIKYI